MKKYLMIGFVAAVAFTSCSKNDFETYSPEEIVKAEYDAKFIAEFGQPASNQTWGFGSGTRAFTRGSNDNKNQWGNPNIGNWQVPPALTEGQVLRVKTYFQQNPYLTFEAPSYKTYFVQQVYKGYSDANNAFSKEIYKNADPNVDDVIGSNHMDELTVGAGNLHVDNFNYGTYNDGDSLAVLNTGATDENNPANKHNDMITLIEDVQPTCVGFNETDASYQHNDHAALVSAATIDAWIEAKYGANFGAKCVDGWERDFVGLDYEAAPLDNILVKNSDGTQKYVTYNQYAKKELFWDGKNFLRADEVRNNPIVTPYGKNIPVVSINMNNYLGEGVNIDQNNLITKFTKAQIEADKNLNKEGLTINGENDVVDLTKLFDIIGTNGYAVEGSAEKFVKNLGGRDYYYTDWIVTLSPAKKQTTQTITYEGRIMAEDLTVADKSDWDFNDVVFDWAIKGGKAYIKLLAAGGTLPLTIGGELVNGEVVGGVEVHSSDKGLGKYMVNTGVNQGPAYKEFVLEGEHNTYTDGDANAIKLYVKKSVNGVQTWVEIKAEKGEPAGKFNSPVGTAWCEEYANIKRVYTNFAAWVENESVTWAVNPVDKYVDYKDVEENKKEAPLTD